MAQFWFWVLCGMVTGSIGGRNAVGMYVFTSLLMLVLAMSTRW